jgi:hypothetical protein
MEAEGVHALAQIEVDRARRQARTNPRWMVRSLSDFDRPRLVLSEDA